MLRCRQEQAAFVCRPAPRLRALALLLAALLASCSGGRDMEELERFVESQVNRPPGPVDPLPEFVSYEPFTYSAANLRSPFQVPVEIAGSEAQPPSEQVRPDEDRPREFLEQFPLGNLTMVGSLRRGGEVWALVRDPEGAVHRVTRGNYLGRNHGRVVEVTDTRIAMTEIVPSGDGGWIERPQTLALRDNE